MNHKWTDSPTSEAAVRLLRSVQTAKSFGALDEALKCARMLCSRQAMQEWELLCITKYGRIQRDLLSQDMARGRVPETEDARRLASRNSGTPARKLVTSHRTLLLPSGKGSI